MTLENFFVETYLDNVDITEKRKNFTEILCSLGIYEIFCVLFKKPKEYDIDEKYSPFLEKLLNFYKTPAGKALRKNCYDKYSSQIIDILYNFDNILEDFNKEYKIWFHNTNLYSKLIIFPKIDELISNSKNSHLLNKLKDNLYYLSSTQKLDFFIDVIENKLFLDINIEEYSKEINEIAYNSFSLIEDRDIIDKILHVYQLIQTDEFVYDPNYITLEEQISKISTYNFSSLEEKKNYNTLKYKQNKIIDSYYEKKLALLNSDEYKVIYNKYIKDGKIDSFWFSAEENFIAKKGIFDYKELKKLLTHFDETLKN